MSERLRVLQIEESRTDAGLLKRAISKAGYAVYSERVVNAVEMRAALAKRSWDLVVAEYRLREFDAPSALSLLHQTAPGTPFLIVSRSVDEKLAVAMIRAGARDYLLKHDLARLAPLVERAIRDTKIRQQSEQHLAHQTARARASENMLREIHHRVKNNMQVMSSLLSLQSRTVSNPEASRMLEESQQRIQSMSLLHEILYQSENLAVVDFSEYIRRMMEQLFRSHGVDRNGRVLLQADVEPIGLERDDALPCGLLITEVVSNSLKHAFPAGRSGVIRIFLRRPSATTISLILSDDGVGLPNGLDWRTSRSLGLRLVRALAEQMQASLDFRSRDGTEVQLVFTARAKRKLDEALGHASGR